MVRRVDHEDRHVRDGEAAVQPVPGLAAVRGGGDARHAGDVDPVGRDRVDGDVPVRPGQRRRGAPGRPGVGAPVGAPEPGGEDDVGAGRVDGDRRDAVGRERRQGRPGRASVRGLEEPPQSRPEIEDVPVGRVDGDGLDEGVPDAREDRGPREPPVEAPVDVVGRPDVDDRRRGGIDDDAPRALDDRGREGGASVRAASEGPRGRGVDDRRVARFERDRPRLEAGLREAPAAAAVERDGESGRRPRHDRGGTKGGDREGAHVGPGGSEGSPEVGFARGGRSCEGRRPEREQDGARGRPRSRPARRARRHRATAA